MHLPKAFRPWYLMTLNILSFTFGANVLHYNGRLISTTKQFYHNFTDLNHHAFLTLAKHVTYLASPE